MIHDVIIQYGIPSFLGLVGSIAHVAILKWGWKEKANIARELVIGTIAGFIYSLTGFPDSIMTFAVGYFGTDFIEGIARAKKPVST